MAIYVNKSNKVTDIFANVNGSKKKIISVWANKNGVPTKVFSISEESDYNIAPANAINNWNYTLDNTNKIITLNYYIGSETDVIVYANYDVNGVIYRTQIASFGENGTANNKYMFSGLSISANRSIKSIKFSSEIDTTNITNMSFMFYECNALTSLNIEIFDTSNVTDMSNVFYKCSYLTSLDIDNFDTSNVITMNNMFYMCINLSHLDLSGFDTSNVTDMGHMFNQCRTLTSLDLSSFHTGNVTDMSGMFGYCSALQTIYVTQDKWLTSQAKTSNMFSACGTSTVTYK